MYSLPQSYNQTSKCKRCISSNAYVEKRAKGANISNKEKELLSYLVYFVGFNSNKKLLEPLADNYNTIKWVMNEKNKARIKVTGDIYM